MMVIQGLAARCGVPVLFLLGSGALAAEAAPQPAKPLGNPGNWVTTSDYPASALREIVEGITGFRLTIDGTGKVAGCQVVSRSGSEDLDKATCDLLTQRARFSPARTVAGDPAEGSYENRVRWILPDTKTETLPAANVLTIFTFIVETDGKPTDCKVLRQEGSTGTPSWNPCVGIESLTRGPVIDASGNPVRQRVTIRSTFTGLSTNMTRISDP